MQNAFPQVGTAASGTFALATTYAAFHFNDSSHPSMANPSITPANQCYQLTDTYHSYPINPNDSLLPHHSGSERTPLPFAAGVTDWTGFPVARQSSAAGPLNLSHWHTHDQEALVTGFVHNLSRADPSDTTVQHLNPEYPDSMAGFLRIANPTLEQSQGMAHLLPLLGLESGEAASFARSTPATCTHRTVNKGPVHQGGVEDRKRSRLLSPKALSANASSQSSRRSASTTFCPFPMTSEKAELSLPIA